MSAGPRLRALLVACAMSVSLGVVAGGHPAAAAGFGLTSAGASSPSTPARG